MTGAPRAATAKVVAMYWALILFGLAIFVGMRLDSISPLGPVCAGTVLGTAMGQVLAWRRFRMWIATVIVIAIGLVVLPELRDELQGKPLWLTFLPAALCGYWSLGDRTSLAAFWFPAMLWMISILDRVETNALPSGTGLGLFVGLVAMFFVFLRVREERRISLWRTIAPSPLAIVKPPVVLQQAHALDVARGVWGLSAAACTLLATAWIAPKLWIAEPLDAGTTAVASTDLGLPCCPKADRAPITHVRVKEYLNLEHGVDHEGAKRPGVDCKVCEAVATGELTSTSGYVPSTGYVPSGGFGYSGPAVDYAPTGTATTSSGAIASATTTSSTPAPVAPGVVSPVPSTFTPPPPISYPPTVAYPPPPVQAAPVDTPPAPVHHAAPTRAAAPTGSIARVSSSAHSIVPDILHWAAVLAAAALLFQLFTLALRPLRRMVALRHFRHPYWNETIDQRVSNAWQLALVGLRDAGFRPNANEQPNALARRVKIAGLDRCATILDRARHGVGLDQDDLATMTSSATEVYSNARCELGPVTRATTWLRWPLV